MNPNLLELGWKGKAEGWSGWLFLGSSLTGTGVPDRRALGRLGWGSTFTLLLDSVWEGVGRLGVTVLVLTRARVVATDNVGATGTVVSPTL